MQRLKILVDMDGIAVDTIPMWLDTIHKDTGVRAYEADISVWDMHKTTPLNTLPPEQLYKWLQTPGFLSGLPPLANSPEVLKKLHDDGHQVYLVTARHGAVSMPETMTWCKNHLPWMKENQIVFCSDKELIPADVLIDDKGAILEKYRSTHPNAYLLSILYPWNKYLQEHEMSRNGHFKMVSRYHDSWNDLYTAIDHHWRNR